MKTFGEFLRESLARPESRTTPVFPSGASWFNSKTGQILPVETTYHAGHVATFPEQFGVTPEELHSSILKFENPQHPQMGTPEEREHLAKKRASQLRSGYTDTHRGVDSLVMGKGWVRVQNSENTLWAQGKAPALHSLAKTVLRDHPGVRSITMDVHGAVETYGHLDPSIQGMAHALEGRDQIQDFVERGGAPHKQYTRIVRGKPNLAEAQEYTSAATSQSQVAKGFGVVAKRIGWERGTVNLDLGGGRYDHGVKFLAGHGVDSHVLDPYNRPQEHNERVSKLVSGRGGADSVTVFNVLNTIKEPEVHHDVLRSAKEHLKPGGKLYLSVYAGDKSGTGRRTKTDSWQRNEPVGAYLETVRKHFPDAELRHGIIHATNS